MTDSASISEPVFEPAELPFRPRELPAEEVHLWLLDVAGLPSPALAGELPIADAASSARASRFMQRFYLRLLLAAYLNVPAHAVKLAKTPTGKPYVAEPRMDASQPPLYFSLSHHAGLLLIAICARHPVGIDLESEARALRQPLKLARRYFHPAEYAYLEQLPAAELRARWLTIWTCKEAVVKATGGGIVSGLDRFAVLPGDDHPQLTAAVNAPDDDPLHRLRLTQLQPHEGMLGALACGRAIERIRGWRLTHPGEE